MRNARGVALLFLTVIVVCHVNYLKAQTFENYSTTNTGANALPDLHITALLEDSGGDLWIGTEYGGLARYDGAEWMTRYVPYAESSDLGLNLISEICELDNGDIWVCTHGGIQTFDGSTWGLITWEDGIIANTVYDMTQTPGGDIWIATAYGLSKFNGSTWTTFTEADGLSENECYGIAADADGNVWIATNSSGVCMYDGTSFTNYLYEDGLLSDWTTSVMVSASNEVWVGTISGISVFDGSGWNSYTEDEGLVYDHVSDLYQAADNTVYASFYAGYGVQGGINVFDGSSWTGYTSSTSELADNRVECVITDGSGDMIAGSLSGLSWFTGSDWTHTSTLSGLVDNNIIDILLSSGGDVWVATEDGLSMFDGTEWTSYSENDGLLSYTIKALGEDADHNIWAATGSGVNKFDGSTWSSFTQSDGLIHNDVRTIVADDTSVWFGTYDGISQYDGTNWINYEHEAPLPGYYVQSSFIDQDGNLWFGFHYNGVCMYDGSTWTSYTTADGLNDDEVNVIRQDEDGLMYFGTDGGLSIFDSSTWDNYYTWDGLPAVIKGMQVVDENVWISSYNGITKWNETSQTVYTYADGLPENDSRDIVMDQSGYFWIATLHGVSRVLMPVGVGETTNDKQVSVYPNPCQNVVYVNNAKPGDTYIVYDINGSAVKTGSLDEHQYVSIESLTNGVYLLEIDQGKTILHSKLIKTD